jgi:transcription elongation factor S-II
LRKLIKKWTNPGFVCVYIDRLRSLCYNLKHTNLWSLLECEEIAIEAVANMNHQEFLPSKWQPLIQKTQLREESKFTNSSQASTDMFVCRKCKSKKCTYYEMQTRSADEPATVFVTCLDCGKHWKS